MSWISVRNWRKFQHYDPAKRAPKWIKVYAELMSDDAFLGLTFAQRGLLVSLWLEYANSRATIRLDTASISRRLNGRATYAQLKTLSDAGFIDIVASKSLADGYHDASLEVEKRREEPPNPNPVVPTTPQPDLNGLSLLGDEPARILAAAARQRALEDEPL